VVIRNREPISPSSIFEIVRDGEEHEHEASADPAFSVD